MLRTLGTSASTWATLLPHSSQITGPSQLMQLAAGSTRLLSTGLSSSAQGDTQAPSLPNDPQGSCSSNHQQEEHAHPTSTRSRPYHHHRYYSTFGPGGRPSAQDEKDDRARWKALSSQEKEINPCNSQMHPAVRAGVITVEGQELSVQEAYTAKSHCFGCGPSHPDGLHLRSYRTMKNGLEAHVRIPAKYCAFPGILNGGILSSLLECHGNWTAAIALMDKACLPKPPLTLTQSMFVTYKEPTPPEKELLVQSQVVSLKQSTRPGQGKSSVEVQVQIFLVPTEEGEAPKLLVQGLGVFKRLGALRAL
ncbi:hypothetical protein DUNSADRAFT_8177 [Dunaliella salina]|uniref:Thioesterase domain-containing protein n=1 Tax=Dunaliella salina TaxID=3046 RepID=A0ABQ7GJW0_DUNSA|nr:hypothetical protein DUNSADRAFT_8177 [Dunaliella salina]|eukprot:KAF5834906.1 hypothetical protein DUNSADRAFT_8177 [Dunaliella salina]